jgi:hypothetical protein
MDDAGRPEPPSEVGRESSPPTSRGNAALQPSWNDLQAEFLQYAAEHAELAAVWRWIYPEGTFPMAVAIALSWGPDADPYDVLRQMYEDPNVSARPPAPKGQWTLEGGSPLSQDLFRVIAGRAASRLPNPSDAEPWRLWLDGLRAEATRRKCPLEASRVKSSGGTLKGSKTDISSMCLMLLPTSVSYGRAPRRQRPIQSHWGRRKPGTLPGWRQLLLRESQRER